MTERGMPLVNGALACPFVAFEDDRDERAASPDHRHRCYAEIRPAPRALAHQEAYCLSSAFPVCPTFQDWARREAARAREGVAEAADEETPAEEIPRRNPAREWSAPPPWRDGQEDDAEELEEEEPSESDVARPGVAGAGVAGSGVAATAVAGAAGASPDEVAAGATPGDQPPRFLAGRSRSGAGLAGSAADRLASGESLPAAASLAAGDPDREPTPNEAGDGFEQDFARAADAERRANPPARSWRGQRVSQTRRSRPPVDPSTPSWEEPRRFEAYPTLKTRMNLPNLPRAGVMAIALVVAAIGLFFLPTLLGVGNNPQTGGGQPSASVAGQSSASIAPTPQPVATPLVYVIQSGDTLEKIRRKFKVTMDALLEANPQIKNPNKIKIGDEITIPTPGASQAPAGSASTAP